VTREAGGAGGAGAAGDFGAGGDAAGGGGTAPVSGRARNVMRTVSFFRGTVEVFVLGFSGGFGGSGLSSLMVFKLLSRENSWFQRPIFDGAGAKCQ